MPDTFPDYKQRYVTGKRLNGVTTQRTSNGELVAWQLWGGVKEEIPMVLPGVSAADRDIVLVFEAAHLGVSFYFTWNQTGVTYLVKFLTEVKVTPIGGGYYDLGFTLGQV